jgi:hypothetical protein
MENAEMLLHSSLARLPALLTTLLLACSSPAAESAPDVPPGPASDFEAGAPAEKQPTASSLPFQPSNVDVVVSGFKSSDLQDVVIHERYCQIDADFAWWPCASDAGFAAPALQFKVITQSDGSRVGVYVVKSLRIEAGAQLLGTGTLPLVIIAVADINIAGDLDLSKIGDGSPHTPGPGKGASGTLELAGGGGSYCGVGGRGATTMSAVLGNTVAAYGNAELIPLVGGSAGGSSGRAVSDASYDSSIHGGGAVQLVAGHSIVIHATGGIVAGGGGGAAGLKYQPSGGGSGGAILLEAATVSVAGYLTANGGGGAGGGSYGPTTSGQPGSADGKPAAGGHDGSYSAGGLGSAAAVLNGGDGSAQPDAWGAGGGGGGAGRIRINTKLGAATVTGIVSPALATACATQGLLK